MISSIKIGCHDVVVTEHPDESNYASSFESCIPAITLMSRRGAYRNVTNIYMASQLLSRVLYAIKTYGNIDNESFDNERCYTMANCILQVLKDNPLLMHCVEEFNPPEKIRIGAFDFMVDTATEDDRETHAAIVDFKRGIINVFPSKGNLKVIDKVKKVVSLWHEIFHVIFTVNTCDALGEDERFIDSMAEWWVMVLRDNPEFVQYLKEVLVRV